MPQPVIWGPVVGIFGEKEINSTARIHLKTQRKTNLEYLISDIMQKRQHQSRLWPRTGLCWGQGEGVLITMVKINMLCLIASGDRLKANLKGYMPQLCMLALCFLSKSLENQCSQHLDTRRLFPQTASDSTSFWEKKKEHATKQRCGGWTGVSH